MQVEPIVFAIDAAVEAVESGSGEELTIAKPNDDMHLMVTYAFSLLQSPL